MTSREIDREGLEGVIKTAEKVSMELIGIPHVFIATHKIKDVDRAWLHISVDANGEEMLNVLREFFRYSDGVMTIAKKAMEQAEKEGVSDDYDGRGRKEAIKRHVAKWAQDKLGISVDPADIKSIEGFDGSASGIGGLIDSLNAALEKEINNEGGDVDELLRRILNNDDKEGDEQA